MHFDVEDFEPPWRHMSENERKRIDRHFGARGGQDRVAGAFLDRQFVDAQGWRIAIPDDRDFPEAEFIAMAETLVEGLGDLRSETIDRKRPKREAGHEETAANEHQKSQSKQRVCRWTRQTAQRRALGFSVSLARRGIAALLFRRSQFPSQARNPAGLSSPCPTNRSRPFKSKLKLETLILYAYTHLIE